MTETIDYSIEYKVEAIPSRQSKELAEKGLGTYPGILQSVSVSWDDRLKKYVNTGFDENALEVLNIRDTVKRKEVQERIIAERKYTEELSGFPEGYMKPTSEFWGTEIVNIEVGQDLKIRVNGGDNILRPSKNHRDRIALTILLNNNNFPKSKADITKPEYIHSRFYITTADELSKFAKESITRKTKAYGYYASLFDDVKKQDRAWEVAYKLGIARTNDGNIEVLQDNMHKSIFEDKSGKMLGAFLEVCELDNATLLIHNMFDKALQLRVIGITNDGWYHRGSTNYRKTKQESIEYLLTPDMNIELAELKSALEGRKKRQKVVS